MSRSDPRSPGGEPSVDHETVAGRHAAIVETELARCLDDASVRAVFLAGSWARPESVPDAEVDLGAIVESEERAGFGYYERDGVAVSVTRTTDADARRLIADDARHLVGYLEARALYDPEGILDTLHDLARAELGGDRVPLELTWYQLYTLRGRLRAAGLADDLAGAAVLADPRQILEGLWLANGLPFPGSPGAVVERLAELDEPDQVGTSVTALLTGSIDERVTAALDVLGWLLPRIEHPPPTRIERPETGRSTG